LAQYNTCAAEALKKNRPQQLGMPQEKMRAKTKEQKET